MAVPKRKTTPHKRKLRRGQHVIKMRGHSLCQNCGENKYPHHICASCGVYRGRQVVDMTKKSKKDDDATSDTVAS